ncbi:HAD family hydrolase [Pseudokineococcus sp. 1T1Z-3]|uniref:HAD family hydrolase n=1 Tax=Pseudokineococcus sp. 1T1Z-3 TaxID=3132745 RepID=UPI0030ADCD7C
MLLDCDGLLVDSESVWLDMVATWCEEEQVAPPTAPALRGLSATDTARVLLAAAESPHTREDRTGQDGGAGTPEAPSALVDQLTGVLAARYSAVLAAGAPPMPGAARLLHALSGRVPLAVASNGRRADVRALLAGAGLLDLVDVVRTVDDVRHGKPAPEVYAAAAAALGVPPEHCVALEDSAVGVAAARAAGCVVVGVNPAADVELTGCLRVASLAEVEIEEVAAPGAAAPAGDGILPAASGG